MTKGYIAGGNGANPLNFKVVDGLDKPLNPRENTVWINTDAEITSWIFSTLEPETPDEGMVWIKTSSTGAAKLNILKKNGIVFAVLNASQYLDGAWVIKPINVYQNGEWLSSDTYLYYKGNLCEEITGGWASKGIGASSDYNTPKAPVIT